MIVAKPIISLSVRPFQVAHLCFDVNGILGESFAELGATVSAFDFAQLYGAFRQALVNQPSDPGRLKHDSDAIEAFTKRSALAALRAETLKAALNKAINARANAVYNKYEQTDNIIANLRKVATDKQARLIRLAQHSENQANQINDLYTHDGKIGVFRSTIATVGGKTTTTGNSTGPATDEKQTSASATIEAQTIESVDVGGYRVPFLENFARNERAQISLQDEQLSNTLQTRNLGRLEEIFKNELASIDTDVNQLQIAYLNTILLSPINGVVTGVYKNPGDAVGAGEPVLRVENNTDVYLVARIVCRGPISIGSFLEVKTTLFDAPGPPLPPLLAPVVSVRGEREDDHWEVIAKHSNFDADRKAIFPIGYHFDYDNTEVNVFGPNEFKNFPPTDS